MSPTFHKALDLGGLAAQVYAADIDSPLPARAVVCLGKLGNLQITAHLTAEQAMDLAEALNDAADWMLQAPHRKAEALEQEQRDQIAGGERVPVTSSERGQFDAAALRMVREEGVLA